MDAEELARDSLPEGVFDNLPDSVKQAMIETHQRLIDIQHQLEDQQPLVEEQLRQNEYRERQARGFELTRQQMVQSNIVKRVGYNTSPIYYNQVGAGSMDESSEFPNVEPNPVSYLGGLIHGFQRSTVESLIERAQLIWDKARTRRPVQRMAHAYIIFHIWAGNTRIGTQPIVVGANIIDCIDTLFENLHILLQYIEERAGAYEQIYNGESTSYIHFYFKANCFPPPSSIDNWGQNIKDIENKELFNIFTANDPNINCIVQVSKRLFKSDCTTIECIIEKAKDFNKNVCILKPYSGINDLSQINSYQDLVIEPLSPVKSISVINPDTIYLLHFNEHLGILENLKQPKRNVYNTTFRPLVKYPNTEKISMAFDIECYFDPENEQRHIPYLCCACFVYDNIPGNVMEFEGRDCIAQMIDYATDIAKEFKLKNIELIAHNGGGYDFHYLLTSMRDPKNVKNIMIRNNQFISFKFEHEKINFSVKDSLNFLLCSLQSAAKAFLNEKDRKTDFPHHEVRTQEDLQRVFQEWISVDRNITSNIEKEKMIVSSTNIIKYKEDGESKKLIDWSKKYCTNDVIVLAKVWVKFKQTVADVFKCEIVDQTYTLASMSFRLFEAHLPTKFNNEKVKLHHPNKKDFINIRKSLIGGRCISINGQYQDIVCLDVKSLYPSAMAYYEQPYGNYRKVTVEIPRDIELGVYYCKVVPNKDIKYHGFFPLKDKGNVSYKDYDDEYEGWYTSIDMLIGREEGHNITAIPFTDTDKDGNPIQNKYVGYSWRHKGKIFKEYIEDVLYKLKLFYEQEGMKEHRWIVKIIMNSLWGKFAQKWMDDEYSIVPEHEINEDDNAYKLWDTDYMLLKKVKGNIQSNKPVQNGIYTLSWARYHMYKTWKAIAKPGAVCVYSDTDSIMVNKEYINMEVKIDIDNKEVPAIGEEMGQLEIEAIFHDLITVGKKQYIGKYGSLTEPRYKKRFKGVPLQYIEPRLFAHLIKSKDHVAKINFLKFKREWGSVRGYVESKEVRQT